MRALTTAALACALLLLLPSSPVSAAILAPEDAAELANTLAEAAADQGVCYGWQFDVDDASGSDGGPDVGSNLGPGKAISGGVPGCEKWVVLTGRVTYTSESSESEDSAGWAIDSNLARPPRVSELRDLGYDSGDMTGDKNDALLVNAVGALPALVADHGEAEPLPFEVSTTPAAQQGAPTDPPSSDFLRENGAMLALFGLLLVGGLGWIAFGIVRKGTSAQTSSD